MKALTNGFWLMLIGGLHQLVGVAGGLGWIAPSGQPRRNVFADILRDGVIGAIETDPQRTVIFWYLLFGVLLLMIGWLVRQMELGGERAPRGTGWQLGALALTGGLLIPASGFWLVLPVAWRIARARR